MRRAATLPAALLAATLLLSGCAGEDKPEGLRESGPAPVLATAKPTVTVPKGPAPTTLQQTDLVTGTGRLVLPGNTVTVQYVGVLYSTGKQFDASWDSGHPFTFQVGNEDVIPGWDQGLLGMRVGGRRQLVIPPDLAYGETGQGDIGPNETLVFVIDLISVDGAVPGADATQGP